MTDDTSRFSDMAERLEADSPEEAADRLESPEVAVEFCAEHGPVRYAECLEDAAETLDEGSRSRRLRLLADAVRIDAPFLWAHPDQLVECVDNRCRWFAGDASRFEVLDEIGSFEASREFEPVEGLDEMLERWRAYDRESTDGPRLAARRPLRDLPGDALDFVARSDHAFDRTAWGPEGEILVGLESERGVVAWDTETGERLWRFDPDDPPDGIGYSGSVESFLVVTRCEAGNERASYSLFIHLLDPATGDEERRLSCDATPQDGFTSVARGAPHVLVGGFERAVLVDLDGSEPHPMSEHTPHGGVLSEDGDRIALGRLDCRDVLLVDRRDDTATSLDAPLDGDREATITALALRGDRLAVGDAEGGVRIWDVETVERLHTFEGGSSVTSLDWSPDGSYLAASWLDPTEETGHGATVWHIDDGAERHRRLSTGIVRTNDLAFSPSGDRLATADTDGRLRVHRLTARRLSPPVIHSDGICTAGLNPEHDLMAVATHRVDDPIRLIDLETGEVLETLSFDEVPDDLEISDRGDHLMARSADDLFGTAVWRREEGGRWRRDLDVGVELLRSIDLDVEDDASMLGVDDDGATHLSNPVAPDDMLLWPTPLIRMENLDAVHLAEGCVWVVAHQCNRVEILEVVE